MGSRVTVISTIDITFKLQPTLEPEKPNSNGNISSRPILRFSFFMQIAPDRYDIHQIQIYEENVLMISAEIRV